jgi:hypothetical protein
VIFRPGILILCAALLVLTGCGERPRKTPTEGAFGQINAASSTNILRAKPPPASALEGTTLLSVLQTELSPAILLQSDEREISFFAGMDQLGRAAPSYAAFSTRGGPRPFKNGERLAPEEMEENWVMVWFSAARGWTNGDIPWVVCLQHKPAAMRLDTNGLHFQFENGAGSVVLLPLYGIYLCPTNETKGALKFVGKPVQTWEWGKVLHREPLMRVRYWASALRRFPYDCEETFSVDRSTDTLTLRQRISYVSIDDDWSTKPLLLIPASPTLSLASRDASLPVKFSRRVMDLEMPTVCGPYMAAETDAPLDAAFRVLHHINEGPTNSPMETAIVKELGTWSQWQPPGDKRDECIAAARVAYRAGNIDAYNYACYLFTRSSTHHHFTNRAADYARTFMAGEIGAPPAEVAPARARLIPSGPPTPFVPGIEREVSEPGAPLAAQVTIVGDQWPQLALRGTDLRFGSIRVGGGALKTSVRLWHSPTSGRVVVLR